MTATRALVHLGPIKTGTTALSRYFTLATRAGVLPSHILYPMGDLWFGLDGDIVRQRYELEQLMEPSDSPHGHPREASQPGSAVDTALAGVANELRSRRGSMATAVFVVETGLPRFDPARLNEMMTRHFDSVDYLFMARRQDKLVSSIVAQNMKMWERKWSTLSPRFELSKFPRLRDFAALDYATQYSRWTSVVGEDHVIVVPYGERDQGSFATIDRIFEFANLGAAPRVDGIEGLRIHPTFSTFGMKKMAWLKAITRVAWLWPPFRARLTAVWDSWTVKYHNQAIEGRPDEDGTPFSPWTLSATDRRWVMRRFRGSNRKLRARFTTHPAEWDEWLARVEEASQ